MVRRYIKISMDSPSEVRLEYIPDLRAATGLANMFFSAPRRYLRVLVPEGVELRPRERFSSPISKPRVCEIL